MIQQILEERNEVIPEVEVGDSIEFDLRKGCVVKGTITSKTDKRAKVTCSSIEGIYQIALKKIVRCEQWMQKNSSRNLENLEIML